MIIDVTQEDIDAAGFGCYRCPIARAVKRAFNRRSGVGVYPGETQVGQNTYPHTPEMRRFIFAFDNSGFVEPQKFNVNWEKYK